MSEEMHMPLKKGKNFKDVIADEKKKGRFTKLFMKRLTSLSTSTLYGGTFLLFFIVIDVALYVLLAPEVLVWAGVLVASALVSSVIAQRITNLLKKQQWKYASYT